MLERLRGGNDMDEVVRESKNFIEEIIEKDLQEDVYGQRVHTRFPPEPNGYLHIGHAKAICTDFGMAKKYNGKCNLRFDDTNPVKEDTEYVDSIMEDVKWLGYEWDELHYASNYFDKLYECAMELIKKGKAYVCDLTAEEVREYRGTLTEPGKNSPYRDRSVEENLDLLERMKKGEFPDGAKILRAKIDMASPNMVMRDPAMYRIAHVHHHRTGDEWNIYPMYDFAHPISDAIEGITHSICTLEFEEHRPLYDWFLEQLEWKQAPKQIEFSRLELTNIVTSKRKLLKLVQDEVVDGWSDPRMPTVAGLRRRGVTPSALRRFCEETPLTKNKGVVEYAYLEHIIREDMKLSEPRIMGVLDPLKVVITNYPEGEIEYLDADNNQEVPEMGKRQIPFGREIYIEREDFMEDAPKKFFRLAPDREVRLKNAYFIKCEEVIKDADGKVIELRCTYDPETKSGTGFTGRKVKGTLHWVSATEAVEAEVRLYDHLFVENEETGESELNDNSLTVLKGCMIEPSIKEAAPGSRYQFFRHGYFVIDTEDTKDGKIVFNRIVSLKSSYRPKK